MTTAKEKSREFAFLSSSIDLRNGFCSETRIYHSLRPSISLPPETTPLSFTSYFFSLHNRHLSSATVAIVDAATNQCILHSQLQPFVKSLAFCLRRETGLSKGDSAYVFSINLPQIPVLFLSLFSLGVTVCTGNPANSVREVSDQVSLCKPVIAFTNSDSVKKLPSFLADHAILMDSPEFNSWMLKSQAEINSSKFQLDEVYQSDTAAILYSSGTTGKFKGVELSHRNFISTVAGSYLSTPVRVKAPIILCAVPFFHVYGFLLSIRDVSFGATLISMKYDFEFMLRTVERFRVTHLALTPSSLVTMVCKLDVASGFDLSSLEVVFCGGAPLANAAIQRFKRIFPNVIITQAYGLTETTGGISRAIGTDESQRLGAVGRLISDCQAKIVDPNSNSNHGLSPLKLGELWVRGPNVMKGYLADKEATDAVLDQEGWLRTGDICYFDEQGFLFYVDRIKELIKYKAHQVAPAELEGLLLSHSDIIDAAVIPYPDEDAGQIPVAFVVKKSGGAIDELSIIDYIAKQVAPYKKIRKVFFINSIPKNATGKVLRKDLIKLPISKL